jgi:hypothetical protein
MAAKFQADSNRYDRRHGCRIGFYSRFARRDGRSDTDLILIKDLISTMLHPAFY